VKVIGFDTATDDTVVAASADGEIVFERLHGPGQDGRPAHSEALLPAIDEAAEALGGWASVERVAVGTGPGTFTGLRIGIATALGLGLSAEVEVAGVSTLAALAVGLAGADLEGLCVPVLDARRGEVFIATYDAAGVEIEPPAALGPEAAVALVRGLEGPVRVGGPGTVRFAELFERGGVEPVEAHPGRSLLSGAAICGLGERADPVAPGSPLEPTYIRTPDAQLWLERDTGQAAG
jgi:tRNA threonylcarbamoyladenosine biosynthesis protein TsaB